MLSRLLQNLDKFFALVGLIVGVVLIWFLLPKGYPELGITLALACIVYLAIANKVPQAFSSFKFQMGRRWYLVSNIAFFALLTYSIIAVLLNSELYFRPVGYFVTTSLLVTLLAVEIVTLPDGKGYIYFALVKVLLIGVSLQWLPQAMFPSLTGIDVFGHSSAVSELLSRGHIPPGYPYARMPLMPLALGMTSLVTGLGYKFSGMLTIGVFYLAASAFVFLIAQRLFDAKIGLLSALMVVISDWFVQNGLWVVPNTMGIALVIFLTYMIFQKKERVAFTSAILLMMAALIMTHSIGAFAFAVALVFIWLGTELYHGLYHQKSQITSVTMPLLFIVATLAYWMYVSGHIGHIAYSIQVAFGLEEKMGSPAVIEYLGEINRSEVLLNRAGLLIFYFLSIIGILALLSRWLKGPDRWCFVLAAAAMSLAAFLGNPVGLVRLIPQRFMGYSQIFLSLPAAWGIVSLSTVFDKRWWKFLLLSGVIVVLSFFLITSPTANRDSPIYSHHMSCRLSFTQSEVQASDTICQIYEGRVTTDSSYKAMFRKEVPAEAIMGYLISKDFTKVDNLVAVREYSVEHLAYGGGAFLKLDYNPRTVLEEQGFLHFYDCGTVSAFLPSGKPLPER